MDPNANLKEQLELVEDILGDIADTGNPDPYDAMRLAELVEALDEWLKKGGFLPEQWRNKK